jgi:hypothetical protein
MSVWIKENKKLSGTSTYEDAGGEQTIIEIDSTDYLFITGILLDLSNMTQDGTLKLYSKIDGSNYRLSESLSFTAAGLEDAVPIRSNYNYRIAISGGFKLTYTEGVDEGADRAIPYSYILEF